MNYRVAVSIVLLGVILGCGREGPKRLPESGFQVDFGSHSVPSEMASGETVSADITIKNISPVTWPSKPDAKGRYAVNLSYHWLDKRGDRVVFDGLRTPLPRDLKPGESVDLKSGIQAPPKPGRYTLEITLVQEHSAWFPERNGGKLVLPVTVMRGREAAAEAEGAAPVSGGAAKKTRSPENADAPEEHAKAAPTPALENIPARQATIKSEKSARSRNSGRGQWSVQIGSYSQARAAARLAEKLKGKGYDAYVSIASVKGKEWHRVRVGHLKRRADAEKLRDALMRAEKLEHSIVTSR